MPRFTLRAILAVLCLFPFCLKAQDDLPTQIQNYLAAYQEEFPVEKAYLHLDKHTFTLGEDIWFSAYLVAGGIQVPSPLSKTLYVDFFDGDGLLLSQRIIQIENGRGAGELQIPRYGKTGLYQIKAYTSWMRNFGEDYFFEQFVKVVDGAGGSFLPQVEYKSVSSEAGKANYEVELLAVNASGEPLANQVLLLSAMAGQEELYRQQIQLNAQGQVSFSFSIPEKDHAEQHLELSFEENPDYIVTQKIQLPYTLNQADIQFLPEGGSWVQGKKATLAFRAVYPDGSPAQISGQIEGVEDSLFESQFGGLGKISFIPDRPNYTAVVKNPFSEQERRIPLPEATQTGLTVQVQNNPDASFISVFIQGEGDPGELLLFSHIRGLVNYMIQGTLTNGVWGVRIPKQNLPSGINTVTVLRKDGTPLLERLVFVQSGDKLDLEVQSRGSLSPRGKFQLELNSSMRGAPTPGSFSVAVADADQVKEESLIHGTIFSHLLLTSDLQGKVYQPGFYFQNQEPATLEQLDLVMMTHGWRRFTVPEILEEKFPENGFYIEQGITITGQVKEQTVTKKGLGGGKISALIGEGLELIGSEYGPDGKFIFTGLEYQDSVSVTITAEDQRAKNFIDLSVDQRKPVFPSLPGKYTAQIVWPEELVATYQARTLMQQLNAEENITDLEGVTVEAQTLQEEQASGRKFYGDGDASIKPDEIPGSVGFTNIFQMIQGRVAGVRVSISGTGASVQIRGAGSIQAGTEPLYLLDNVPVDASLLFTVNPRDVQSIDVFKDPARTAIFGSQGANGVIAVYTKTGAGISYQSVGGTLVVRYGGYHANREFYAPKYDQASPQTAITDQRATILWNPLVETDANGQAKLEFFNSDLAKRHLIIIEGIDAMGRIGRTVKLIE
ncbi:TonB-dependent receptor plug domain-containing protein [Algoriphagus confluentis]|uniref:TonB-dependent receptor plug domain-containing protein n=1 Tax=Algoriphagus confluentis TaxID=1697556 RepID=A0ABQ6PJ36_9BACT|nr:TonB-dependent receptor plug domain-containing protein [Algoriphagus confluentis]